MPKALRFHSLGGPEVLRFEDIRSRKPASGEVLRTTPFPLTTFGRRIAVYGYTFLEMKRYIFDRLSDGTFRLRIAQMFSFADAVEACRFLESNQQIGKFVVR